MFGMLLVAIGSFFGETSALIGKAEVQKKKETIYSMAFLALFWGTLWFLGVIIVKGAFQFSLASLPTFTVRMIIDLALIHISALAIVRSERSTFGFVRTGTLPLILVADIALGYAISPAQIAGIVLIIFTLLIAFMNHGLDKHGLGLVVVSAILPAITISLFKYNITHFNSVEAEQFLSQLIALIYFAGASIILGHEHPFKMLTRKVFFLQSFSHGIASVLISFAFIFAPASIITAAKRSFSVLWSVIAGNVYLHEKHLLLKIAVFILLTVGIVLLVL